MDSDKEILNLQIVVLTCKGRKQIRRTLEDVVRVYMKETDL